VILAGGLGTRLAEETAVKPKPMVEIGGRPILWHIMKGYVHHGFKDFVICLGYKGEVIKSYFLGCPYLHNDFTIHLDDGRITVHAGQSPDWRVTLVDTGPNTQTGGRIRRVRELRRRSCGHQHPRPGCLSPPPRPPGHGHGGKTSGSFRSPSRDR